MSILGDDNKGLGMDSRLSALADTKNGPWAQISEDFDLFWIFLGSGTRLNRFPWPVWLQIDQISSDFVGFLSVSWHFPIFGIFWLGIQDPGFRILDPGSWILDPGSWILDQGPSKKYKKLENVTKRTNIQRNRTKFCQFGARRVRGTCLEGSRTQKKSKKGQILGFWG